MIPRRSFRLLAGLVLILIMGVQFKSRPFTSVPPTVSNKDETNTNNNNTKKTFSDLTANSEIAGTEIANILQASVTYRYPKKLLQQSSDEIDLVVGILSAPQNRRMRDAIRETWGRNHCILFVVGGKDWDTNAELRSEFSKHRDILWIDRPETYDGLTYKTFCWVDFARKHLRTAEYLYKTDDDVYLNIHTLQKVLNKFQRPVYMGKTLHMTIKRDPTEKWHVSEEQYPNATMFHPFNIGGGYAISSKVFDVPHGSISNTSCVAYEMEHQSFLPLEDVSIGWIMHKCNVPYQYDGWEYWDNPWMFEYGAAQTWDAHINYLTPEWRNNKEVVNVYEIKFPEILRRYHVEYCLDHGNDASGIIRRNCDGFDLSCANPRPNAYLQRSDKCHFVKCAGNRTATNCESCPTSSIVSPSFVDLCNSQDCQWCRFGTKGDNGENGALKNNFTTFQEDKNRCIPRIGPVCRTQEEAEEIRDAPSSEEK